MPSKLNPLAREFIPRIISAQAAGDASSPSSNSSPAQRLQREQQEQQTHQECQERQELGMVEGQVRLKQEIQRQEPVMLKRSTCQVPRTLKTRWGGESGWQYSPSYQHAQGIANRDGIKENVPSWQTYEASPDEAQKAKEVDAVWRRYGAMLNNERAFDGGYYGEYIAGEKLRCYEVELRGVRMDLDEAQRLAYQLAEYHNCLAKSKNQRNCHDKLAAQAILASDEILYHVPQLAMECKIYPLRTVLNGEVKGFPESLWDLEMLSVDQVLDLITVYEGNKPNGTEKELRRRLNDHIGVVTTFG